MADVFDLNRKFREDLLRREYKSVRNVLRAYERSWKSIARDLEALTRKIEAAQLAGVEISPSWFYREARYRTLMEEINSRYQQLAKECTEFTSAGVKMAVPLGARHAYKLGKNVIIGEFAGLHSSATESMIGLFSGGPVRALFAELGPVALREASRVLIDAMTKGENPRKAAKLMRDAVEGLTKRRAVLIARTEIIRSYRMAAQRTYQLNADVLSGWRWTCAKTRATCPVCLAMDGEIFPLTETLSSHPACRCSMVPVPAIDFGAPAPITGAEWFKKQPAFAQDRILGSRPKGRLFRAGEFQLKDLVEKTYSARWGGSYTERSARTLQQLSKAGKLRTADSPPLSGFLPKQMQVTPKVRKQRLSNQYTELIEKGNSPEKAFEIIAKKATRPSLTPEDKEATKAYIHSGYDRINAALYDDSTGIWKDRAERLERLTSVGVKGSDVELYRGMRGTFDYQPGEEIKLGNGFVSTTIDPENGRFFARANRELGEADDHSSVFRIQADSDTRGIFIDKEAGSTSYGEKEFLLHPGTKFEYIGKTIDKEGYTIHSVKVRKPRVPVKEPSPLNKLLGVFRKR